MPENMFFREPKTQTILLDILFIFCKLNADISYRQGMHEVLAPILWVVSTEAIDPGSLDDEVSDDSDLGLVKEALNYDFVEHDAFTIYCVVMQSVKSFYEMGGPTTAGSPHNSPIVERSRRIHEEILRKADPELTQHLTDIEVLPQIFIM
jgi:TBC1 domain family protein 5